MIFMFLTQNSFLNRKISHEIESQGQWNSSMVNVLVAKTGLMSSILGHMLKKQQQKTLASCLIYTLEFSCSYLAHNNRERWKKERVKEWRREQNTGFNYFLLKWYSVLCFDSGWIISTFIMIRKEDYQELEYILTNIRSSFQQGL